MNFHDSIRLPTYQEWLRMSEAPGRRNASPGLTEIDYCVSHTKGSTDPQDYFELFEAIRSWEDRRYARLGDGVQVSSRRLPAIYYLKLRLHHLLLDFMVESPKMNLKDLNDRLVKGGDWGILRRQIVPVRPEFRTTGLGHYLSKTMASDEIVGPIGKMERLAKKYWYETFQLKTRSDWPRSRAMEF